MIRSLLAITLLLASTVPAVQAQGVGAQLTCIPVEQLAQTRTQLECRLSTPETPYFLVAELTLPFKVSKVVKVSSGFSGTVASLYPATLAENTIVVAALHYGDAQTRAGLQAVPFDSLSFLVETDLALSLVKKSFVDKRSSIALLSPNPSEPLNPFFQTITPAQSLRFDGSLILESFTQYVSPSVLQFLRLGLACYEKSPQECLTNVIQNL